MSSASHSLFREQTSNKGKRERTRSALLDSAISVFASKGFEATKITDITNHAGMANGTFYNYYRDKEEVMRDVAAGLTIEITRQINDEMEGIEDAQIRVPTATMRILETAREEPEWIEVLLGSFRYEPELQSAALQYLRQDLEQGIAQGKFDVEVDILLINHFIALVRTAVLLDRSISENTIRRTCESVLRLLGVTPKRARATVTKILERKQLMKQHSTDHSSDHVTQTGEES